MVIHTDRAEAGGLLASPTCPPNGPSNTKFSAFPSNSAPHSNQTHLALEVVVPCRTIGLQYRLLAFRRTKYFWPQQGRSYSSGARFERTEISRLLAKSPELAGLPAGAWSLRAAKWIPTAISAPLSLASKFRFPATETAPSRERFECAATAGKGVLRLRLVIPEGKLARFVSATDSEVSVAIGMLPTQAAL
jgi:hypothetical protein